MLTLVFLCLPVLGVSAAPQERTADYTVEYIGRGDGTEQTLGKKTFRALAGETVNVETEDFANYEREPGQDMTLLVTADGTAVKKIYYTRIFYDRIVFQTQGSYIPPVYGNRGDDIREEMSRIPEPVRPGFIFPGVGTGTAGEHAGGRTAGTCPVGTGGESVYRAKMDGACGG